MHKLALECQGGIGVAAGPETLCLAASAERLFLWCSLTKPAQGRQLLPKPETRFKIAVAGRFLQFAR